MSSSSTLTFPDGNQFHPQNDQSLLYALQADCVGADRIELSPHAPKARILPLDHAPIISTFLKTLYPTHLCVVPRAGIEPTRL